MYHLRAAHHPDYVPALARCSTGAFWSAHRVGPSVAAMRVSWSFRRLDSQLPSLNVQLSHISAVDGGRLNPMINQRSANVAGTAIKAMTTRTETADANG